MKKRTPTQRMTEDEFINSATSHTLAVPAVESKPQGRKRTYKAISVSLTDSHVEMIDEIIVLAARNGIVRITRSDVIKLAIDGLAGNNEAQLLALLKARS
ncbi:hypothetical protein EDC48_102266 [Gibbsiella quercinecans]|uniref:Uncharacterized protein n=2 Tax=Gibbsiella TaxID=929812 RepID=A0A250AXS5_9GAMM|nr:hypothetical protein [Gibbsiella quercinecans]ATA18739.1 hypothetical protein AWC35_04930 [Gibbsiella quercinecans]RLM11953.1 hypothetical protein BIY31_02970 [Gibbsiella quercinecans]RLM14988.1 hypothetical protein BIY30_00690 [Gibbsiella quercinecans]RLM15870.1 hypothetical protein BIY27_03560 [Gibbsiella quercinecans]TCT91730.1 hypothetical protein EDC48_102266 [Gibbsiella quercinecans]